MTNTEGENLAAAIPLSEWEGGEPPCRVTHEKAGWICSRQLGHYGEHRAWGDKGKPCYCVWPNEAELVWREAPGTPACDYTGLSDEEIVNVLLNGPDEISDAHLRELISHVRSHAIAGPQQDNGWTLYRVLGVLEDPYATPKDCDEAAEYLKRRLARGEQ